MELNEFPVAGSTSQKPRLIITGAETLDEAQASGAWIGAEKTVQPEDWR